MDDLDSIRDIFFEECKENLEILEDKLENFDSENYDEECISSIFRAVHSIKGGAAAFGINNIVDFANDFESVLSCVRSEKIHLDKGAISSLITASDCLSDIVFSSKNNEEIDIEKFSPVKAEIEQIVESYNNKKNLELDINDFQGISFSPSLISLDIKDFFITIYPKRELYSCGDDIRNLFSSLSKLGIFRSKIKIDKIPSIMEMEEKNLT